MTVLLVNKFHYVKGGAERYYLDLGEYLAARGDRVMYLSMEHPANRPAGEDDAFVRGVDYRSEMGWRARVREGMRSIYNAEAAQLARRIVRARRPHVAHLHNIYHQLSPSVIRALAAEGIPIVQTLHDYKLICPAYLLLTEGRICERCKGARYAQAYRHRCLLESRGASAVAAVEAYLHHMFGTYEQVSLFLCPSRFMLEKVHEFGIPREKLVHLPYFLPIERYEPAPVVADYYVYAGRLSREKGVATLLEAHALLPATGRPPLRILGDGPLRADLEARATALGLPDVVFEGFQEPRRLKEIVGASSFVVVPSEWYENYPYAILEAFALARPVVGASVGGIPELVREGETGWLAPMGDPRGLAEAIARAAGDRGRALDLGRAARAWVAGHLAPGSHLDQLDAIYARLSR